MSAGLVAPVIPPAGRRHAAARRGAASCLPLACPPDLAPAAEAVYGTGRVDASGRVASAAVAGALGWRAGDRLTVTASAGVVVARRDPAGMVTLPSGPCLVIPAPLRRRCGLRPGDRVLLAALPGQDAAAAWPFTVVDQALRAGGCFPAPGGGQR